MSNSIACIMNIALTVFAIYGIVVYSKWHKVTKELEVMIEEQKEDDLCEETAVK